MQLTEAQNEGLLRVYRVVIPASDLQAELDAKIKDIQPKVRINGFRPGKVPPSHIRKVYGAGMMQEIINEQVQKSTEGALREAKARPAVEPKLDLKSDLTQVQDGKADLTFDLRIEVMPEFEPADPGTIAITRPVAPVEDAQVDDALANIVKANRTYETKDGAAADGDQVVIDFVGKIDGRPFQGGAAEQAPLVLGSKQFIPGFEDQLIGVMAGEERTLDITFPEDYAASDYAGKAATFEVKVHEVKAPKESQADDEFAKQMGFETIAEVREAIRSRIEAEHAEQSRAKAKRALFDALDRLHTFALPPGMVESEFNQIWRQVEADREEGRIDPDEAGKSDEQLRAEYRRIAERRVRLGLVLAAIGEKGAVTVSDQEVGAALQDQARRFPGRERQVIEMYRKNPALLAQLRAPIYEEKVVDYILELTKVTTETVDRETLFAEDPPLDFSEPATEEATAKPKKAKKAKDETAE
ncbi:MAG: trigger factor [Hydrogenophilaceae bacterium]|jgi:trigger factor|nr:trigger factor [Hydrogenophilaceae bacterium]